jgi:hypothetical protein
MQSKHIPPAFRRSHLPTDADVWGHYHPKSAYIFGRAPNLLEQLKNDQHENERRENYYYPFADQEEWGLAKFLCETMTGTDIDRFMGLLALGISKSY